MKRWYIKPQEIEQVGTSAISFSRLDALDFVRWTLSEVATRAPSKHQGAPFVSEHMARQTEPRYMRGSDLSERLFVSVEVLLQSGFARKEALVIVTERAKKFLGKTRRGRPRVGRTGRDFVSTLESVRSMVNAFVRRKRYPEDAVDRWVGKFFWERKMGVIRGAEFVPEFGGRMHTTWVRAMSQVRVSLWFRLIQLRGMAPQLFPNSSNFTNGAGMLGKHS